MPTKQQIQKQLDECRTKKAEQASELADANTRVSELETDVEQAETLLNAQATQIADLKVRLAECEGNPNPPPPPSTAWRPYSTASIFNTPISANPQVESNSAALVAQLKADRGAWNPWFSADDTYSHPVYFAKDTDPLYKITLTEEWGTSTQGMTFRMPATAKPERGSDGHLSVFARDGYEYSFWQARIDHAAHTVTASFGGRTQIAGTGAMGLATALGYGGAAGNITGEELAAGKIEHALFAVVAHTNGQRDNGAWSQGSTASGDWPAMGQRFYLEGPVSTAGLIPWQAAIITALNKYGLIIGDTGGGFFKAESPLPYTTVGKQPPLLGVRSDGRFAPVSIDWSKMRALAA